MSNSAVMTSDSQGEQMRGPSRLLLRLVGMMFFGIGLVGTVVPVLPTTIFWILAALCLVRSHPESYRRIVEWPRIGPAIRELVEDGTMRREAKLAAWGGMALSGIIVTVISPATSLYVWPALAVCALIVAWFPGTRR